MNVHLVLPDLFWPQPQGGGAYAGLDLPALEIVFGRGRRTARDAASLEHWLAERYGLSLEGELPVAPYALLGEDADPGTSGWLRVDPCHLRLGIDQLVLADAATFALDTAEADALVAALNAHFAADGIALRAPHPERWYATMEPLPAMETTPLAAARAQSVDPLLPRGRDARAWHARLNELQMVLHAHPVNEAREARGAPAVNSVWAWGAGRMGGAPPQRAFSGVRAADPFALGLARASGATTHPVPATAHAWLEAAPAEGVEAIVLDALRVPAAYGDEPAWRERLETIERHWLAPLHEALRAGQVGMLTVHAMGAGGALQVETTRQDLRYFWRRPKPLAAWQDAAALR
jgi:hypothetical protein